MRRDPEDLIDAATAERLLAGDAVGPRRLANLLSRATAAAREHELRGEDTAMAAFRASRRAAVHPARRRFRAAAWARLATVKVGAIALVVAVTGVALAAGTGILPRHLPGMAPTSSSPSGPANSAYRSAPNSGDGRGTGSPLGLSPPPPQALDGLCRAYLAQVSDKPDKILENPMFDALVRAAGAADKVRAFCDTLTHGASPTTNASPGKSGDHPAGPPTSKPSPHPRPSHTGE